MCFEQPHHKWLLETHVASRYELPPVSWTTKIKSKEREAFHVYKSGNEA